MATVDGITVAKADQIDKKHIALMAVAGSDLVLTRENGSVLSAALPAGGGGPLGSMAIWDPICTELAGLVAGSRRLKMHNWKTYDGYGGDPIAISSGVSDEGFGLVEPGWYQITFKLNVGFTVVTTALPEYLRLLWNNSSGASCQWDLPVFAADPGGSMLAWNRSRPGVLAACTTPVFYDEGDVITGGGGNDNYVIMGWPGDATLSTGDGLASRYSIQAVISRLA